MASIQCKVCFRPQKALVVHSCNERKLTEDEEQKRQKWREGSKINGSSNSEKRRWGSGWRAGQHQMKDDGRGWSNGIDVWPIAHQRLPGWCAKIRF